jgi:hypothetical protein
MFKQSQIRNQKSQIFQIPSARLERATHSLEGCCSIQLSYESERATQIITRLTHNASNLKKHFGKKLT